MRALIAAVGTRGDVQPALALALEFRKLGHAVRLCISPNFLDQARSLGLDALPMGVEMRAPKQDAGTIPKLTPEQIRRLRESMPDQIADQFETLGAAIDGCDVIVGANAHQYAGPSIAEHARIRSVTAVYAPVAIPSPDLGPPPMPGQKVVTSHSSGIRKQWLDTARAWNERALDRVNRNRDKLGLKPISDVLDYALTDHTWLAADPVLAPVPETPGRKVFQTGTWVLPDRTALPPDLEAFLEAGLPPIFVSFGSMPVAGDVVRLLTRAARASRRRLIVSRGWADLGLLDDGRDCIATSDVSHEVLFPRVAAVIHHGGAGTTAAAARAGVPQIVTPLFGDQFYWARRVVELGAGLAIPHAEMTVELLSGALQKVFDPAVVAGARALAAQVGRDGAEVAARRLEAMCGETLN